MKSTFASLVLRGGLIRLAEKWLFRVGKGTRQERINAGLRSWRTLGHDVAKRYQALAFDNRGGLIQNKLDPGFV